MPIILPLEWTVGSLTYSKRCDELHRHIAHVTRESIGSQKQKDKNAGEESAQVRPVCGAILHAILVGINCRRNLDEQVIQHKPKRTDLWPGGDKSNKPQSTDLSAWEKHKISTNYPKDGAARPDGWDIHARLGQGSHQAGGGTGQKIIDQVSARAAGIFHAAAKYPEEKHIAKEMGNSTMQKHGCDRRNNPSTLPCPDQIRGDPKDQKHTAKHIHGQCQFPDQDHGIDHDQSNGHVGKGAVTIGFSIVEWNHRSP